CFFFQAEDGIRDFHVTGVQTCALPIYNSTLIFRARIGGTRFDDEGNLWVQQSTAEPGYRSLMHKKTPNDTWESIDLLATGNDTRSEEHTSELQSREKLVCRCLLEKKIV